MEKLLIADISVPFCAALEKAFENQFEVYRCTTGDEALRLLEVWKPYVLILNLRLPYMDGLEVLRSSTYKPPVILAMTTHASPYTLQASQNAGVDFIVMLPCTVASMVNHVREMTQMEKMGKRIATPQQIAEAHLLRLGIPAHLGGFTLLRVGIPLFVQDEQQSLNKELYPAIAELCGSSSVKSVERSIRRIILQSWQNRNRATWEEYFPERTVYPTNKEFIAVLAQKVRQSAPDKIW